MTKFIWHNDAWVEAVRAPYKPRIHIIRDGMQALLHPANGKVIDSKSAFRKITKEYGYEELGNDAPTTPTRAQSEGVKDDVLQAYEMIEQGYVPPPLETAEPDTRLY